MKANVRYAIRTFAIAFLALFVPGLLGWLNDLTQWARDQGSTPFPDAHGLAYLGVSAITAGAIALVNLLWRGVEDATGKGFLRDVTQGEHERGAASTRTVAVVVIAVVAVVLLVWAF